MKVIERLKPQEIVRRVEALFALAGQIEAWFQKGEVLVKLRL